MIDIALILACAPTVAPATIQQIIQVESKGDPLAIGVNGGRLPRPAKNAADAAALARAAIQQGYSVDLGLMQVNSKNLARLGYTVEDMFDSCKNLAAGAKVLTDFYVRATARHSDPQVALRLALSAYNTGSFSRGFRNGYVSRYFPNETTAGDPIRLEQVESRLSGSGEREPDLFTSSSIVFTKGATITAMQNSDTTKPIISADEADAIVPGVQVEHSPESAESYGAFEETAMSEADAWEANTDLHATAIVVGGKHIGATKE